MPKCCLGSWCLQPYYYEPNLSQGMKQNVVAREEQATERDYVDDMCNVCRQAATALIVANEGRHTGGCRRRESLGMLG